MKDLQLDSHDLHLSPEGERQLAIRDGQKDSRARLTALQAATLNATMLRRRFGKSPFVSSAAEKINPN
jgi:hypothetical protein